MEIYSTEEEQVERIKKCLKEYGPTILISILIVVAGTFGWRYWNNREYTLHADASNYYEQLVNSAASNNTAAVTSQAAALMKNYKNTPYAKLAALQLARQDVLEGKMSEAETQLRWVMEQSNANNLKQIARNRLAKLLIAQKKPEEALKTLTKVDDEAYRAAINILRGDAYTALNKTQEAKQAYKAALAALPEKSDSRPLLEMKLMNLPL